MIYQNALTGENLDAIIWSRPYIITPFFLFIKVDFAIENLFHYKEELRVNNFRVIDVSTRTAKHTKEVCKCNA